MNFRSSTELAKAEAKNGIETKLIPALIKTTSSVECRMRKWL